MSYFITIEAFYKPFFIPITSVSWVELVGGLTKASVIIVFVPRFIVSLFSCEIYSMTSMVSSFLRARITRIFGVFYCAAVVPLPDEVETMDFSFCDAGIVLLVCTKIRNGGLHFITKCHEIIRCPESTPLHLRPLKLLSGRYQVIAFYCLVLFYFS